MNKTAPDASSVDRIFTTVAHNETWIERQNVTVSDELTGDGL